jgi:hypothetical protein
MKTTHFIKLLQLIFIIALITSLPYATCANEDAEHLDYTYSDTLSIGVGTLCVILAGVLGLIVCIFGLATAIPEVFVIIGIIIPCFVLLICCVIPYDDGDDAMGTENKTTNTNIVARWVYFTVMLLCTLALFAPMCILWNVMVVPQRVDSRAQKEYDEKYKLLLEEEMRKKELEKKQAENNVDVANDERNGGVKTYQNPALNIPGNKHEEQKKKLVRRKLPPIQRQEQQQPQQPQQPQENNVLVE